MNVRNISLFIGLLLNTNVALANFVETDWLDEGDSLATLHEETGIEWLDISITDNMSIDNVVNEMGEGGIFYGWRFPTENEMLFMMESFFDGVFDVREGVRYQVYGDWNAVEGSSFDESNRDARFLFFSDFFGTTYESGDYAQSRAVFLNEGDDILISGIRTNQSSEFRETTLNEAAYYNMPSTSESYFAWGVWLVSDGGETLSSMLDPSINQNNIKNVSIQGASFALSMIAFLFAGIRRRTRRL